MLFVLLAITSIFLIVYAYRRPAVSFALVLSMFGIEQLAGSMSIFFLTHRSLINIAIGLLVLVSIVGKFARREISLSIFLRSSWIAITLYFLAFCSLVWTPDPAVAWSNWIKALPYVLTLILLMPLLIQNIKDLESGLFYLTLIGLVTVVLISLFGEYQGRGLVLADAKSTSNPLAVAQLGAYVIFAMVLQRFTGAMRLLVLGRWGIVIVALLVIAFSGSRGQLIFMFAALLLMLPTARQVKSPISFASTGIVILLLGLIGNWVFSEYLEGDWRWSSEGLQQDAEGRLEMALALLRQWLDSPGAWLFGLGTSAAFDIVGFYPHIVPLEIIGEEGILGIALFLLFIYRTWTAFMKLLSRFKNNDQICGQVATIGAIVFFEFLLMWKQGSLLTSIFFFGAAIILQSLEISSKHYLNNIVGCAPILDKNASISGIKMNCYKSI